MPAERSDRWRGLAASALQELLLARVWGIGDDELSVRVVHDDAARAIDESTTLETTRTLAPRRDASRMAS